MDQLKQFLVVVKKQHFWILCGLVVLIGFVMYAIASSKMNETYVQTKGKISTTSNALDPLLSGTEHPNRDWAELVQKKTEDLRNNVRDAWEDLYNEQKQQVFVWPAALGNRFCRRFQCSDGEHRFAKNGRVLRTLSGIRENRAPRTWRKSSTPNGSKKEMNRAPPPPDDAWPAGAGTLWNSRHHVQRARKNL